MSVTVLERPQKDILDSNGEVRLNSLFNASGGILPTQYKLSNTISPINTADTTYEVVSVENISQRLKVVLDDDSFDDRYNVDAWITITNSNSGIFIGQIVTISGDEVQTTIPYDPVFATGTNVFVWHAKDYEVLINVYVGLNPNHVDYSEQPNTLIAQKSITSFIYDEALLINTGSVNITGIIKSVIDAEFKDIETTELNLKQYTQFRIEYAEIYKRINPSTLANELFDGTNYQSDWVLGQPEFIEDEFSCSGANLQNEEFATNLDDWTNEGIGIAWVWDSGTALASTSPVFGGWLSQNLEQPFSYVSNAQYNIKADISGDDTFNFEIYLKDSVSGNTNTIYRRIVQNGTTYVVDYNFSASMFFGFFPDMIGFNAWNSGTIANDITVDYFRQTQANEGCLPYLSAMYSVRQFGAKYNGSMGDYEGDLGSKGKLLTHFTNKVLNSSDVYPEISLIGNSTVTNNRIIAVKATVSYSDNSTVDYYSQTDNSGEGVYRVVLTDILESIQSQIEAGLFVTNIDLVGVSSVQNMLADLDEGTFEATLGGTMSPWLADNIGDVAIPNNSTAHPRTGMYSGEIQNPVSFTSLGRGAKTDSSLSLIGGQTYVFTGYVLIGQDDESSFQQYVEDPLNESFISLAIIDQSDNIITTDVVYDKIHGNVTSYRKTIATYTPSIDIEVKLGVYKGGTNGAVGAQLVYFDDLRFEGPEIEITDSIPATYKESKTCTGVNMKWLNDLGGWENHFFDGKTYTEIDINDNKRYSAYVLNDLSVGTGIGFEQSVNYNKIITVSTTVINTELKKALSTIKTSIHVLMYDEELEKYITVLVDKGSFTYVRDSESTYKFSFDCMLPDNFVQNA